MVSHQKRNFISHKLQLIYVCVLLRAMDSKLPPEAAALRLRMEGARLLHALTLAHADGSFTALLRSLAKINLLIIDDWMRDPITLSNAQDILEVLDDRFGHTATLIASQVPVSDWHLRIPDPTLADAILDRLVHNAQRIELKGESQRKLRAGRSMPNT